MADGNPTLVLPVLEQTSPNSSVSIGGISYEDAAAAINPGAIYLRISASQGTLFATDSHGAPVGGASTLTLSAPYADVTAALGSLTYSADANAGSDVIAFDIWDQYGIETTGTVPVSISQGNPGNWVQTWAASPEPPVLGTDDPGLTSPSFSNQTIRETIRLSAGGNTLRLRLTDEFRDSSLTVGAMHVALSNGPGAVVPGSDHVVTFAGNGSTTLAPGTTATSDPVPFAVGPNTDLNVSVYVPGNTGPVTWNQFGDTSPIVNGNQTATTSLSDGSTVVSRPILSSVDVQGGGTDGAIIALGDSVSVVDPDLDQNDRWTDDLSQRLRSSATSDLSVVNAGISGNRVLADGTGPSAISRFGRDVASAPGARYVLVEEGINDIRAGSSASDIEDGYRQLIGLAHAAGLTILGSTLTPFGGSFDDSPAHEQVRDEVNNWIRTSGAFDAIIDFDAAVHDPQNSQWWLPAYDNGSHLHPNGAGAAAMANAIDLSMFGASPPSSGPQLSEPAGETVSSEGTVSVPGHYSDAFAQSNPGLLYLSINDSTGTLMASDSRANPVSSGTSSIALSLSYGDVNAVLQSLTYTASSAAGSDTININVWNQVGVETTASVPVAITAGGSSSSGPTLNTPTAEAVATGATVAVPGSYSDTFAQQNPGLLFIGITDDSGSLSATDSSGAVVTGSATATIAMSADFVDVNAILAGLQYTAKSGMGSDTIRFEVWNQAGAETTAATQIRVEADSVTQAATSLRGASFVNPSATDILASRPLTTNSGSGPILPFESLIREAIVGPRLSISPS